jgi:hypothetical protein
MFRLLLFLFSLGHQWIIDRLDKLGHLVINSLYATGGYGFGTQYLYYATVCAEIATRSLCVSYAGA